MSNKQSMIFIVLIASAISLQAVEDNAVKPLVRNVLKIQQIMKEQNIALNQEAISRALVNAMITAVDPQAVILTKEQAQRRKEDLRGFFYGAGLAIKKGEKFWQIVRVLDDGPSAGSDLQPGDRIVTINQQTTENMSIEEIVDLLRGEEGEIVELEVCAETEETGEPRSVKIARDIIQIPATAIIEEWPQGIDYIKINGLFRESGVEAVIQMNIWMTTNHFGLIMDLRGANGIDLDAIADIASLFSKPDTKLFSVCDGQNKVITTYKAKKSKRMNMPVMLLIDSATSNSAEALAAILHGCSGVMLIGTPTAGDNRIREFIPLVDDKVLYIATSHVALAKGKSYVEKGVLPDIVISEAEQEKYIQQLPNEPKNDYFSALSESEKDDRALIKRVNSDYVLRRATDILLGIKALDMRTH